MAARKAVEQELTRERILDVARELFVTHGYRNVSMRQIARELGYSHGSIYYHFQNKAELFYALVREYFSLLDKKLETIMRKPGHSLEKLEEVLLGFIEFGFTHQSHYEIMFLIKDDEVNHYLCQEPTISYNKFADLVHKLSDGRADSTKIWSLFLSLHGFVSHYCRSGQTFADVETMAKAHVGFLLKGLGLFFNNN
ncbi:MULTISPECIES: TetR/AcrR family transcriptional regulator [Aneurinibacillus]|uniref:TetR/AcrR family transcriptional regulator n=1 Tax=Aneurinibacillus thermoaerophilus TaxID=143495 RepID=A0A1G8ALA5_ANETH|nr:MULTISPECIES: TetR/AcrR family transcriptional regulator [Aneurinibacillus]AMA71504.1 TetR family transcriptional regulator [Aneurinibacillus sp. XH2]MED0675313.1 TetR/AcrR family transcriptional regulator [Aneurinibacillus thermoaerophilus]MED0678605.1 TetR/AcrR family transcriptional regulator [Aneurinibacillus thermoaerophilus]MED0738306.1 TetR/AcrR family transcriptional regulator [Aneurinibacillus thermoaerophilus]MED0756559.1 TetR/AcrR family transcriptional regulator [Aneurinibacillu